MWQDYEKDFSRISHMTPNFHIAFSLANKLSLFFTNCFSLTYISNIRLYGIF